MRSELKLKPHEFYKWKRVVTLKKLGGVDEGVILQPPPPPLRRRPHANHIPPQPRGK